jgi:dihydrofolate reductase
VRTSAIVAAADNDVIGKGADLPWHLPADLRRFRQHTSGHVVVAGRRTHESIVTRLGRPLPGRTTVVVSRQAPVAAEGVLHAATPEEALRLARRVEAEATKDEVFVIGGAQVYAATLAAVDRIYLTRVHLQADGDVVMPAGWLGGFTLVEEEAGDPGPVPHTFLTYERA